MINTLLTSPGNKRALWAWLYVISGLLVSCSPSPILRYAKSDEVLRWEKDIREFERNDSLETHPEDAVLLTGSSSIRLWSNIEKDMAPYPVIQRGYGGAKISDLAVYCRRIIYPHNFKALVVFVANDITGGEHDKEPEEVLALYQYIVKQVRKKYAKTPIFFIQITPTNSRWAAWDRISKANSLIGEYSLKQENLYFIETAYQFIGANGNPRSELFKEDQLHLNDDGYVIWTRIIKENLDNILK